MSEHALFVDFWPSATTDKEIIADRLNTLSKLAVWFADMGAVLGQYEGQDPVRMVGFDTDSPSHYGVPLPAASLTDLDQESES